MQGRMRSPPSRVIATAAHSGIPRISPHRGRSWHHSRTPCRRTAGCRASTGRFPSTTLDTSRIHLLAQSIAAETCQRQAIHDDERVGYLIFLRKRPYILLQRVFTLHTYNRPCECTAKTRNVSDLAGGKRAGIAAPQKREVRPRSHRRIDETPLDPYTQRANRGGQMLATRSLMGGDGG